MRTRRPTNQRAHRQAPVQANLKVERVSEAFAPAPGRRPAIIPAPQCQVPARRGQTNLQGARGKDVLPPALDDECDNVFTPRAPGRPVYFQGGWGRGAIPPAPVSNLQLVIIQVTSTFMMKI